MRSGAGAAEKACQAQDVKSRGALNSEFHQRLYAAAPRRLSKDFIQRVNYQTDRYIRLQLSLTGALAAAEREHRELLDLCPKGDIPAASDLLRSHIVAAKRQLIEAITEYRARKTVPRAAPKTDRG